MLNKMLMDAVALPPLMGKYRSGRDIHSRFGSGGNGVKHCKDNSCSE